MANDLEMAESALVRTTTRDLRAQRLSAAAGHTARMPARASVRIAAEEQAAPRPIRRNLTPEPVRAGTFPVTTFAIQRPRAHCSRGVLEVLGATGDRSWWITPVRAIGVLGGFTSSPTMCVEGDALVATGHTSRWRRST